MPKLTIKKQNLPQGHPALTASRKWKAEAKRLLQRTPIRTRVRRDRDLFPLESPVRNTKLFYRIASITELFPDAYEQTHWAVIDPEDLPSWSSAGRKDLDKTLCGTAFCIAGHAVHETGWAPAFEHDWDDVMRPRGDRSFDIGDIGALELGLTVDEGNYLFASNWTPKEGMTVAEVLRAIGDGARIDSVTSKEYVGSEPALRGPEKIRVTGIKE